ncbi:MFS transporter [Glycomyces algeriensis]|uniref:MFS transporter n=1 Tax=Glycomyces algeriensis TaxID=256037 RepID=A0A9W6GBU5_9ACTN|nr:MFS transporter [Glycomyces algeriensis]MDA1365538.1 MFS transporter [Glycomyces algeriensis]MDR7351225.1 MFS family permease [Glycomyces algeriensis]GLI43937.1 MFS transporter [Glycomyces algeriensis]
MLSVLRHRTYRHLFAAQAIALAGTGLATVALSLLAYDLAGARAGAVLGTALAIKMLAYLLIGPVATALAERVPRRTLLCAMDIARAAVALALPFVTEVWQVYVLVLVLQAASAAFTPTFQAVIPEILPREADYTKALSLSRLAYDLESLFSPALAAVLLALAGYQWLFTGTTIGFLASAVLVASVALPKPAPARRGGRWAETTRGFRLYLATPRLRGLLLMHLAVAAATAMVIVNTVVLVQDVLGRGTGDVAVALGAFGIGSMTAALLLPGLLKRRTDRQVMLPAACVLAAGLAVLTAALAGGALAWAGLLALWAVLGAATGAILTPTGRLVAASATPADRPAAFAAQFSLSHGWFLIAYPVAGWLAAQANPAVAAGALAACATTAAVAGLLVWPRRDTAVLPHVHTRLDPADPHLAGAHAAAHGWTHSHNFVIDALHTHWPANGATSACDERAPARRKSVSVG